MMTNIPQGWQWLHIYLVGGQQIDVMCENYEIVWNGLGTLKSLSITGGCPRMAYLNISKVIGVFVEDVGATA